MSQPGEDVPLKNPVLFLPSQRTYLVKCKPLSFVLSSSPRSLLTDLRHLSGCRRRPRRPPRAGPFLAAPGASHPLRQRREGRGAAGRRGCGAGGGREGGAEGRGSCGAGGRASRPRSAPAAGSQAERGGVRTQRRAPGTLLGQRTETLQNEVFTEKRFLIRARRPPAGAAGGGCPRRGWPKPPGQQAALRPSPASSFF